MKLANKIFGTLTLLYISATALFGQEADSTIAKEGPNIMKMAELKPFIDEFNTKYVKTSDKIEIQYEKEAGYLCMRAFNKEGKVLGFESFLNYINDNKVDIHYRGKVNIEKDIAIIEQFLDVEGKSSYEESTEKEVKDFEKEDFKFRYSTIF